MHEEYNPSFQDIILNNGQLFNTIRKRKPADEKIKKIIKYLERGADINAADANDIGNTPLHIAVMKGELQVVTVLLDRKANVCVKNYAGQTALDVAHLSNFTDSEEIIKILRQHGNKVPQLQKTINNGDVESKITVSHLNENEKPKEHNEKTNNALIDTKCYYQKRKGTSGLSGHLYETKLITLILLRAESDEDISEFYLGTNIEGLGAFDDIVFKYKRNGFQEPKILFLQAKHKDDPIADKVTVDEVFQQKGDFCLQKYLDSYLEINKKIGSDMDDSIFKGSQIKNCEFIIYTSATENFNKKQIIEHSDEENLMKTCDNGKTFQFKYDDEDFKKIIQNVVESRAVSIAKRLTKFISKDKHTNMMADDMIKMYHVFLAQNIFFLQTQDLTPNSPYINGKFQQTFLDTTNDLFLIMKHTIINELRNNKATILTDVENELKSLSFKLPSNFGNIRFYLSGSEKKKQRRISYLCSTFRKLFGIAYKKGSKFIVEINESNIGHNEILQEKDLESYRLGGLVGNLLIFDEETNMLKFNQNDENISEESLKLLEYLQNEFCDLNQYRLDIKMFRFPKLTLMANELDKKLVKDFLGNLKFYTNQAKEDQVETILKNEILSICSMKKNDSLFQAKCEAIFLKFHDKILKWWKRPKSSPYLTKTSQLFCKTEQEILNSPLLNIYDFIYINNLKKCEARFKPIVIEALEFEIFFYGDVRIMVLTSDELSFTSIKLTQYCNGKSCKTYAFLDLDYDSTEQDFVILLDELKVTKIDVLALVFQASNSKDLKEKIKGVTNAYQGKIIIITNNVGVRVISTTLTENIVEKHDTENRFIDLDEEVQRVILEQRKLNFQGELISFNAELLKFSKPNLIRKIINKENIYVGKTLSTTIYKKTVPFYINQSICRFIKIRTPESETDLYFMNSIATGKNPDLLLLLEDKKQFEEMCMKFRDYNVHWFTHKINGFNIWLKSRGHIKALMNFIDRGTHVDYTLKPEIIQDIKEKIVIISAEPGMGKSSLLVHLAVQTKKMFPNMWISKINLVEHVSTFSRWKKDNTNITFKEALKFLYSAIGLNILKDLDNVDTNAFLEKICNLINHNLFDDVHVNNVIKSDSFDLDLLEIDLFNHCLNNNNVALLFDGFDEICPDYAHVVIQLFDTLKSFRLAHIWITTRPYHTVLQELESALNTFSFTLQPLSTSEQKILLHKILKIPLNMGENNGIIIEHYLDSLFTSIPLHIYMIADILNYNLGETRNPTRRVVETYNDFIKKVLKLCTLYETFVDIKFFKIRFGEKKPYMNLQEPDIRKMVHQQREVFLDIHKKIGAYALFSGTPLMMFFSMKDITEMTDFIDSVKSGDEKTGIVECMVGYDFRFIHLTLAEYFAMEFISDKLEYGSCDSDILQFLCLYIVSSDKKGIHRFLNSKLEIKPRLFNSIIVSTKLSGAIFEILLSQISVPPNSLYVMINEEYDNIAMFLLQCVKTVINQENLDNFINVLKKKCLKYCTFCLVVVRNNVSILKYLLDIIRQIDGSKIKQLLHCKNNPLKLACICQLAGTKTISLLLDEIVDDKNFMVDLFTLQLHTDFTVSHAIGMHYTSNFFISYLVQLSMEQRKIIFTIKDLEGQLPAHIAAKSTNYDYFETMEYLLSKEDFVKICKTKDATGFTPIMYFPYDEFSSMNFKNLIQKVYDENVTIDIKDFVLHKFRDNLE